MSSRLHDLAKKGSKDPYIRLWETANAMANWGLPEGAADSSEVRLAYYFIIELSGETGINIQSQEDTRDFNQALQTAIDNVLSQPMIFEHNYYADEVQQLMRANGTEFTHGGRYLYDRK
ncbi:MAG: hypothetical protein AAF583_02430 [Pseudomonadota bacterium]